MNITVTLDTDTTKNRAYYYTEPRMRWINGAYVQNGYRSVTNRRASDRPDGNGIVYISWEDESLLDDLVNRRSRPYLLVKEPIKAELQRHGIDTTGMRWSQRAGCSCPCSPGFLLPKHKGHDVWVKVTLDQPARTDDALAAVRLEQLVNDPTLPFGAAVQS